MSRLGVAAASISLPILIQIWTTFTVRSQWRGQQAEVMRWGSCKVDWCCFSLKGYTSWIFQSLPFSMTQFLIRRPLGGFWFSTWPRWCCSHTTCKAEVPWEYKSSRLPALCGYSSNKKGQNCIYPLPLWWKLSSSDPKRSWSVYTLQPVPSANGEHQIPI